MAPPGITVRLSQDTDAARAAPVLPYCGQKFEELKRQCLQQRTLFTDAYFGARPDSVGYSELGPGSVATKGLVWKRPKVGHNLLASCLWVARDGNLFAKKADGFSSGVSRSFGTRGPYIFGHGAGIFRNSRGTT